MNFPIFISLLIVLIPKIKYITVQNYANMVISLIREICGSKPATINTIARMDSRDSDPPVHASRHIHAYREPFYTA